MVESNDIVYQMYENGEVDSVNLSESNMMTIYNDPNHKFHNQLVQRDTKSIPVRFVSTMINTMKTVHRMKTGTRQ